MSLERLEVLVADVKHGVLDEVLAGAAGDRPAGDRHCDSRNRAHRGPCLRTADHGENARDWPRTPACANLARCAGVGHWA